MEDLIMFPKFVTRGVTLRKNIKLVAPEQRLHVSVTKPKKKLFSHKHSIPN